MELLKFTVRNQSLSGGRTKLISGSIDYIEAYFDFRTSDWSGLDKWAHFSKGETTYDVNLVDDKITREMHLNLEPGIWEVKLHGDANENGEVSMRITTDTAHIIVEDYGELHEGGVLPEISATASEQIAAKAQNAVDIANSVRADADAGAFDTVSDEQIKKAVEDYLLENPPEDSGDYEERIANLESNMAELLYVPIAVSSFSHNAGTRENGDTVSSVVLSWVLNKEPSSVYVDGTAIRTAVKSGSYTANGPFTANKTWTLKATDERDAEATKTATLSFVDGIYYGTAEEPERIDSEFILSLAKVLASSKNRTVSVAGGEGLYFWYAYPKTMGTSVFNIGGFDYEYSVQTVSFTNAFGVTKDYYVYRSVQPIPGSVSITVKGG